MNRIKPILQSEPFWFFARIGGFYGSLFLASEFGDGWLAILILILVAHVHQFGISRL